MCFFLKDVLQKIQLRANRPEQGMTMDLEVAVVVNLLGTVMVTTQQTDAMRKEKGLTSP